MAVTARGRTYARLIRAKRKTLADIDKNLIKDVKDSYRALYDEDLTE